MSNLNFSIYCPHCHMHTSLQIAPAEYKDGYQSKYTGAIWKKGEFEKWWIGVCNNCQQPVLVQNAGERVFPYTMPSPTDARIPEPMHKDLIEAKQCYNVNAFRGCAVMARRAMQATCIDKGATKKDLVDQLKELQSNGIITADLKDWATVVRWVGNDAAHPNKDEVTKEDAEDILKLAEQFLHIIYVAPAIANERKAKRGKP